jgi:hypothetical protein
VVDRQRPYETVFLEKFPSLTKMLIHRVPTKIPTSSREKEVGWLGATVRHSVAALSGSVIAVQSNYGVA